jgi:putative flippase GtrA
VWSYVGHRRISFRSEQPHRVAGPRFAVVTATGQGLAIAIPAVMADLAGMPQLAATAAVCVVCPAASFILNSRYVFADGRHAPDQT